MGRFLRHTTTRQDDISIVDDFCCRPQECLSTCRHLRLQESCPDLDRRDSLLDQQSVVPGCKER